MANIPTVPGTSQVQTPEATVKLDYNALNAPNRAAQGFAGALSEVGDVAAQFGKQLQDARNFGLAADADRQMRQATADFQASRAGRTDEENWGNEWKDRAAEVRDSILNQQGVGSDLRRVLDNNLKNWGQSNSIEVATIAKKQMINRTVERTAGALDEAAKAGAPDEDFQRLLSPLVKVGAVYPEKAQQMFKTYTDLKDKYAADNFIEAHPPQAIDWLSEKDKDGNYVNVPRLNPEQRRIMMVNAEKRARAFQSDNYDDAKLDIDNGVVPTTDAILARENKGDYSARQAAGLRTYIKVKGSQPKIEEQPKNAADVTAMINAIPQGLDPDSRRPYITDIVTSHSYLKLMEPARRQMDEWMKQDAVAEKPVVSEVLKQAEQMYRDGFFLPRAMEDVKTPSGHWYTRDQVTGQKPSDKPDLGADNPDADASHWLKTAPREIVDATQMHYAQYLTRMRAYAKANPKASDADVTKESQRLMEPYVMSAVAQSLRPQAPQFTPGKRVRQAGKVYEFDGKNWNEVQ